jgi:hypothetical protein
LADPKDKKPESEQKPKSEQAQEHELPFEIPGHEGGDDLLPESPSMSASIEEFHFSGPAEALDFTEPADFPFPTGQPGEAEEHAGHSGEFAPAEAVEGEHFFDAEHGFGSPQVADAGVEAFIAGEGIPDVEAAEPELAEEEEKVKPKRELPAWVRKFEWIAVTLLGVAGLLALVITPFVLVDAKLVTLIVNIACPVMLGLVFYALWRSSPRWATGDGSAIYTAMLAISVAAWIGGTWFLGMELSSYQWKFSKTRVAANMPRIERIPPPPAPK